MNFLIILLVELAYFMRDISTSPISASPMVLKLCINNNILQLCNCLRGGNSYGTDGSEDSEEEDNFRDLRKLFGQNSDDSTQSRSDGEKNKKSIQENKQVMKPNPRSSVGDVVDADTDGTLKISPLAAAALIWRGMPSVIKFAGWCLVMESARLLWQTVHTMRSDRKNSNQLSKARSRSSFASTGMSPRMIDADDYLSGLDSELIMDPSISSTSSTNRGGSSSSSQPLSSSSSTISLEQLQADSAELWSAVAKLHGIQTDFAASHQAAETAAEARWLGAVRELEGMVSSVQGLSNSMQQRLGELGQAVESLSQELDELQAQVSLEDAALQSIICVMDVI